MIEKGFLLKKNTIEDSQNEIIAKITLHIEKVEYNKVLDIVGNHSRGKSKAILKTAQFLTKVPVVKSILPPILMDRALFSLVDKANQQFASLASIYQIDMLKITEK